MHWEDRIGRRLKLRDLHTLVTVARTGSMAKASAYLAISQPAVSKTIAGMEHTFGVRLLDRRAHGVEPTIYGEALLKRADTLFGDLRDAVQEIESLADPAAGEVRLGASGPVLDGMLPVALDRFLRRYPKVTFTIGGQGGTIGQSLQELRRRKLDVWVGRMPAGLLGDDLSTEVLFPEPIFVVTAPSNTMARYKRLRLADLEDEPWVLPGHDTSPGAFIAEAFRAAGVGLPGNVLTVNDLGFSSAMIQTGRFFGMFPGSYLHFGSKRALKVLPIKLAIQPPPVALTILRNRTLRPAVERFMDCLRDVCKPLRRPGRAQ